MSSITVFTVATCPYSKQVKGALESYNLPYNEISLSEFPQKRKDLLQLTGDKTSVPQVFVHTEWIGGVDETLGWLRIHGNNWHVMKEQGVGGNNVMMIRGSNRSSAGGCSNPRFMVPIREEELGFDYTCHEEDDDDNDDTMNIYTTATQPISGGLASTTTEERTSGDLSTSNGSSSTTTAGTSVTDTIRISCPDGTSLTVLQMTEKLKRILQYGRRRYNFTTYKSCCTAEEIVDAFVEHYKISRSQAVEFGKYLQRHQFMSHVCDDHAFQDSNAYFFRLQAFQTPGIINTYRIWPTTTTRTTTTTTTMSDPKQVMERLTILFQRIEEAIIGPDGYINYRVAYMCSDFPAFEDAVCELQSVDLSTLYGAEMVAFALNVYNMMRKYSFMKLGVPASDSCRISFCNQVRFNVAGHVFSLQEWLDGILRGNRKSPVTKTHAFSSSKKDPRIELASKVGEAYSRDCRIHFAIQCWSRSRRSPPVKTFTGSSLDEELTFVAHAFCEEDDNVAFHCKEKRMRLAPVFRTYKADFLEKNTTIPKAVLRFLDGPRKAKLENFLTTRSRSAVRALKMSSRAEDWTLGIGDFIPFDTDSIRPNVRRIGKCVRSTTCASSYRPDKPDVHQNSCASDDGSSSHLGPVVGRLSSPWLPTRKNSSGKIKRNKTDSIPKPFSRRYVDNPAAADHHPDHQRTSMMMVDAYDEMDSNVSSTSVCSSNISEKLQTLGEPIHLRSIANVLSQ